MAYFKLYRMPVLETDGKYPIFLKESDNYSELEEEAQRMAAENSEFDEDDFLIAEPA